MLSITDRQYAIRQEGLMQLGLQVPNYTWPGGPAALGADLASIARAADDAGFDYLALPGTARTRARHLSSSRSHPTQLATCSRSTVDQSA